MNNNDYLSRQPYLDLLKSIITNQKDNSTGYSFAIDGEWGCGKTWILTELEKQLTDDSERKYLIFHYNAWENDFYDEPLVALLSVMIDYLESINKKDIVIDGINVKLARTAIKTLKTLAISFANTKLKEQTGLEFKDVIEDFSDVKNAVSSQKKLNESIDSFFHLKKGIHEIRNQLEILSEIAHILIVVDELDRCLPEYAIKVLERLHHICNEIPVTQILAINKKNLADSISKVYGKDFSHNNEPDTWTNIFFESYLQKFVDIIIPLPNGKIDTRIEVLNGLEKDYNSYIRPNND